MTDVNGVAASLDVAGPGTVDIRSANTYGGGTVVNSGTLRVNNTSGSGTGSGTVTVRSGATLGGTGTIGGQVVLEPGAILDPGNSIGTLSMSSLLVGANSILTVELGDAGTSNLLAIAERFDFSTPTGAGPVVVGFSALGAISTGTEYRIARFAQGQTNIAAPNSQFVPVAYGSLATIDGTFTFQNDGSYSYLTFTPSAFEPVPVSPMWVTLPTGVVMLGMGRWQRQRRRGADA
jgi:autotransporter-associated beta strand protein